MEARVLLPPQDGTRTRESRQAYMLVCWGRETWDGVASSWADDSKLALSLQKPRICIIFLEDLLEFFIFLQSVIFGIFDYQKLETRAQCSIKRLFWKTTSFHAPGPLQGRPWTVLRVPEISLRTAGPSQ